uniref:Isoquinoline 1-oxidoreductase subunit beta n=1 Tax=Brevundimonas diminuta TaxID=293 RepID=IORB_BREDI|nr:RecName: Full=Isoquinoline 1-oxidoreductase subunit beta [Brevundimonas diminuta]CAA88754.1 isoquinoline 1-oxidoreductase [Brevundimonas diminuta]
MKTVLPSVPETVRLSRRGFLVQAGTITCSVAFGSVPAAAGDTAESTPSIAAVSPNVWVRVHADGIVDIVCPAVELGQGAHTALPRFVAEELDADWDRVRVQQAGASDKVYGNPLAWGTQFTAASRTTVGYFDVLRVAGAQARFVLVQTAARRWSVPADQLETQKGVVLHRRSRRSATYGELVASVQVPESFPHFFARNEATQPADDYFGAAPPSVVAQAAGPASGAIALKHRSTYRLIGKDAPRKDIPPKVNGQACYGMDVQVPGMLYAMVETGPVAGMAPERVDDGAARQVPGIHHVLSLPHGVAVVGRDIFAVRAARARLLVNWKANPDKQSYDSGQVLDEFSDLCRNGIERNAVQAWKQGELSSIDAVFARPDVRIESFEMQSDLVYQAPMEPQSAVIQPHADGSAEAWVGTQWPTVEQGFAAGILGIAPDKLTMHLPLVGGGFGRRLEPGALVDAAHIVRAIGKTVKVIWSREDDLKRNPFRQALACRVEAAVLEKDQRILALRHTVAADSWLARLFPQYFNAYQQTDPGNWIGGMVAYDVPLQRIDALTPRRSVDVCYMRGIGVAQVKFAQESLVDQIARRLNADPVDFRLAHLNTSPRGAAVVRTVAEMSDWKRRSADAGGGMALGLAYTPYSNAHVALVSEVHFNRSENTLSVSRVWCAVDVGMVAQPDIVKAQMEGGIIQGLSVALMERVQVAKGVLQHSNFHDYPMLRMSQVPQIHVRLVETDQAMAGVAELGLLQIGPAINNAFARITGQHLRSLPMRPALAQMKRSGPTA